MKTYLKIIVKRSFFVLLMFLCIHTRGINYYIDSNGGSDSNSGTGTTNAWQSYEAINAHSFNPGDTIFFKCGSVFCGNLRFYHSGVPGNPIVLTSYGTGTKPTLSNPGELYAIQLGGSYIIVENFLIQQTFESGIQLINSAQNNIIRNCEFNEVGIGVTVSGKYNKITNNYLHDLHMVVNTPGGNDDYGATGVSLYSGPNEISYNTFINCRDTSYDYGQDGGVIDFYGNVDSCTIHHNYAEGCNGFFEIGGGTAISDTFAYNISMNNIYYGAIHLSGTFASTVNNLHLENNTIIETADTEMVYALLWFSAPGNDSTVYFQNNIVYFNKYWYFSNDSTFTHRYNVYHLLDNNTQLGFTPAAGEIIADPLFENILAGNFHLNYNSPAIDAGTNLGYLLDFENNAVPNGISPDIGAYEYQGTLNASLNQTDNTAIIYPNPANEVITIENPAGSEYLECFLYNIDGKLILQKQINQNKTVLDISGILNGIYLVKLTNEQKAEVKLIVKK